ncbi:MAG TPA: CDP-alcohol phosphatidyltransferase family protein [Actinomycetota bacterium]|nr:CDP-alcohol phosphatidyltransferase family protein [Actinomycetota bacterium]
MVRERRPGARRGLRPRRAAPHPHSPAPRLRDLPAPRPSRGAIGPLFGAAAFAWPYRLVLAGLYRAGFRPWQLTLLSLTGNGVVAWLLLSGRSFLPGMLLLVAGLLDVFDGALARLRGEASRRGAFLDSVVDRLSDMVVFGALFWALARHGDEVEAGLALAALVVSLLVSHVRAEAEAAGLSLTEGLMQRLERYVLLMVGLTAPRALLPVLALLAGLGAVTLLQRVVLAWRQLARTAKKEE